MMRQTSSSTTSARVAATTIITQQQQHYNGRITKCASYHFQNQLQSSSLHQRQQQSLKPHQRNLLFNCFTARHYSHVFQQRRRQCLLSSSSSLFQSHGSALFSTKSSLSPPPRLSLTPPLDQYIKSQSSQLSTRTHHLLNEIERGQMTTKDISELRTLQVEWSNIHTIKGAKTSEDILNRLILEREHSLLQLRETKIEEKIKKKIVVVGSTPYNIAINAWSRCNDSNEAPEKAMEILNKLKQQYKKEEALLENTPHEKDDAILATIARPDTISYNTALYAWSNSSGKREDAADKVEEILSEMESSTSTEVPKPDRTTYNTVMNTYANLTSTKYGFAKKAEDILFKMSELSSTDGSTDGLSSNYEMHPDTNSFNIVLKAWSNLLEENSLNRGEEILQLMLKLSSQGIVIPNGVSFGTVITSCSKIKDVEEAVNKMEELLTLFEKTCLGGEDKREVEGIVSCYNAALNVIAKSGLEGAGTKAEEVINRMKDVGGVEPDVVSLTSVMKAWSRQGTEKGTDRAEELLRQMMESDGAKPNTITFNVLMDAWSKSSALSDDEIARRIENLYRLMKKYNCHPNTATCSILMQAYSKSSKDMSLKAHDVLHKMERDHRQYGNIHAKPDGYAFNAVLSMLSKSNHSKKGKLSYDVIMRMLKYEDTAMFVDTITFNIAIAAQGGDYSHANAADAAAKRAMTLFGTMEKMRRDNPDVTRIQPDTISFTSVMNVLQRSNDVKSSHLAMNLLKRMEELEKGGSEVVRLDAVAFRVALRVFSRFGDAKRAKEVFGWMEELYESGREDLKPDEACCNSVLRAQVCSSEEPKEVPSSKRKRWGRQANQRGASDATKSSTIAAAECAQNLLVHMIQRFRQGEVDILPGQGGFNTVVQAWAAVGDTKSIRKAEMIIKLMEDLYESGAINFSANSATYTIIINALVKSTMDGATERAMDLFDQMESKGLLDTIAFNTAIGVLAKSTDPNKAEKAESLLRKMIAMEDAGSLSVKADIVTYNTVLNACAFTRGSVEDKRKALSIAEETFNQIESRNLTPQQLTYGTMIKAYTNLADEKADKVGFIKPIFKGCAEKGLVGSMITKEIRYALSDAQQKSLLESVSGQEGVDIKIIPSRWRCNIGKNS